MSAGFRLEDYLIDLHEKGFKFKKDVISFIYFGKQLTGASDYIISLSIEITLKTQKRFDSSFYLALLETLVEHKIETKQQAEQLAYQMGLLKALG